MTSLAHSGSCTLSKLKYIATLEHQGTTPQQGRLMTSKPQEAAFVQTTAHPYIVRLAGICGGRPTIKGSRISVCHIAQLYKAGDTVEEILQSHHHLQAAAVYDAISYYLDHQQEIEREITENRLETLMKKGGLKIDERGFIQLNGTTSAQ
jgi:uncharacterized protein (DUF433 family)